MPTLTIFLCTHNRAQYLAKAIDSILTQSFKDFQLIILDNASQDGTQVLVNRYADDRIVYYRNETNIGALANANKALELGKSLDTEFIGLFHDDDIMLPTMLESEIEVFRTHEDVILVATNSEYIDEDDKCIRKKGVQIGHDVTFRRNEYIESFFRYKISLPTPGVMIRRSIILENNYCLRPDIGPAADNYLWFEMNLLDKKLYLINQPLLKYRIHPYQDSKINYFEMEFGLIRGTFEFLGRNNLQYLSPIVRRSATKEIVKSLARRRCLNRLSKEAYLEIYNRFLSNNLIEKKGSILDKIHSFIAFNIPELLRPLYKLKK
jgi:glycosyltransferase involved in cell wall biosynthesis